uniref:Uncharacterized protein n=2 Tax=unclassified Caudoviricetes TaxID=2788787 RepID=A0A8S5Q773_9CAUD|nr:MAG TPA: hypothetical protein [Siphoviridae sp. ctAvK3]DAE15183.1 MAG TPA: hypothetical protein [Siphoviridae sp. ctdVv30]
MNLKEHWWKCVISAPLVMHAMVVHLVRKTRIGIFAIYLHFFITR